MNNPLVCFSDATPSRVAFVSNRGCFPDLWPDSCLYLSNSEFLAGYACVCAHLPFSKNLLLFLVIFEFFTIFILTLLPIVI